MSTPHHPDPEFVGNLERELNAAMRRHERFRNGSPMSASMIRKLRWTTGVVALVAMCLGSAGTYAVTQRIRARTAELIVARSEAHLEFSDARLEMFREEMQETESRAEEGLITPMELEHMRLQFAEIETEAATRALDVEESRITGLDPDNSLSAPLQRGRDFVTERLELEKSMVEQRGALIEKEASRYEQGSNESAAMAHQTEIARAALAVVEERLTLRADFLAGIRTAREVELASMKFSVGREREAADRIVEELQRQMDRMQTLAEQGMVSRSEMRAVEMQYRGAMLQRDLADLEMQILESKLAGPSGE